MKREYKLENIYPSSWSSQSGLAAAAHGGVEDDDLQDPVDTPKRK